MSACLIEVNSSPLAQAIAVLNRANVAEDIVAVIAKEQEGIVMIIIYPFNSNFEDIDKTTWTRSGTNSRSKSEPT